MSGRILIADDAGFMREMLREILSDAGYSIVAEAVDGAEAVAYFKEHWTRNISPCITTVGISLLFHPDMMIEIEGIAILD